MAAAGLTEPARDTFLDALAVEADAAASAAGYGEHFYEIGGLRVHLRFAGSEDLVRLTSALSHLRASPTEDVSLGVSIWDGASCGLGTPDGPWRETIGRGIAARGEAPGARGFFLTHKGALTAYDRVRRQGYYWLKKAPPEPWGERASPLSPIFGAWLDEHDIHLVHAGAVGSGSGCVLLAGATGSGKSHVSLRCVDAGHGYIGDDTCLLVPGNPPLVRSIYSSAQPALLTQKELPSLLSIPESGSAAGEKALLFLHGRAPDLMLREAPLRAIAIAVPASSRATTVEPASPVEALLALAPRSLLQLPGAGSTTMKALARIAEGVRCVRISWGRESDGIATAVSSLLEEESA